MGTSPIRHFDDGFGGDDREERGKVGREAEFSGSLLGDRDWGREWRGGSGKRGVFVSRGRRNRGPQTGWLKTTEIDSVTTLEATCPIKELAEWVPSGGPKRRVPSSLLASVVASDPRRPSACSHSRLLHVHMAVSPCVPAYASSLPLRRTLGRVYLELAMQPAAAGGSYKDAAPLPRTRHASI